MIAQSSLSVSVAIGAPEPPVMMMTESAAAHLAAVVVTFNPDAGFGERLARIADQFDHVFVVDNASTASISAMVDGSPAMTLLENAQNLGVGAALNQGLEAAHATGFSHIVSFDQDTWILDGFRRKLEREWFAVRKLGHPDAILGANYLDEVRERAAHRVGESGSIPALTVITSGMLVAVPFARSIGGFRADYFIDSIDHEFCLRAAAMGLPVFRTMQPLMRHSIGHTGTRPAWARALSSRHPPLRKYFIARNAILTIRRYGWKVPAWSIRQLARLLAEAVGILLFEPAKRARLFHLLRGAWDGVTYPNGY